MSYRIRKTRYGYLDMGPARIPPLPQYLVMRDRADGTDYLLTHTGEVGNLEFALSAVLPTSPDVIFHGPHDGPYLAGTVRLYLDGGSLHGERVDRAWSIAGPRVLTRRDNERAFLEIGLPDTWHIGDDFTFTEILV